MKKFTLLMYFFILVTITKGTNQTDCTYIKYHTLINQAERCYFISKNIDSTFYYYNQAFKQYDYIFIKDLLNAAQISIFEHKKTYKQYLLLGFKYGLQFKHFKYFKLLQPIKTKLERDSSFVKKARLNRKQYINRIDFECLLKVYRIGIKDQIEKCKSDKIYKDFQIQTLKDIKAWINNYGFPSSKIIGINDRTIFSEIGMHQFDIDSLKTKYSNSLNYYSLNEKQLSQSTILTVLIHNFCSYSILESELYTAMLKGELHPREIGFIYDNSYRFNDPKCKNPDIKNGVFLLNSFCPYKKLNIDINKVNILRKKWHIVEVEVDNIKKEFEKLYGFKLFYGMWKCM